MNNTYGYIRGTEGVDGDHIDVFLSDDIDGWDGRRVYVIDQYNTDGTFDEHKVMLGFNSEDEAFAAYLSNYDPSWANDHKTVCTSVTIDEFEKWIESSHRKTKPFAEYKTVDKTVLLESVEQAKEVDEYGNPFVLASDGSSDFGVIDAESGLKQAPIKLSMGVNTIDEQGHNHGYGLLHIEAERGDAIREAGYASVQDFVERVAQNYTDIREGGIIANNQTYLLELVDEHNDTLFVQLSKNGEYWTINSAGIFRKKYSRNKRKVYDRPALGSDTNTNISGVDSGHIDGVTTPAGNSPQTSNAKDTTNIPNNQETSAAGSAQSLMSGAGAADDSALVSKAIGKTFVRQGKTEDGSPYNETLTLLSEANGIVEAELNTAGYGGHHRMSVAEAAEALRHGRWEEPQSTEAQGTTPQGYTVEKRFHKKNNTNIYAVKFTEQMLREQFVELKKRVKDFGGYYSSFGCQQRQKRVVFKSAYSMQLFENKDIAIWEGKKNNSCPIVTSQPTQFRSISDRTGIWENPFRAVV